MIPIYQKIVDPGKGDCMRAVICSLLEIEDVDSVPNFLTEESWFASMYKFLYERGYDLCYSSLFNKNYNILQSPTASCFEKVKWYKPSMLTKKNLAKLESVNGYYWGSVLSPKYCTSANGYFNTHAVVIDKDCNIVHDPNPEYKNILEYPLAKFLKYNGVYHVAEIKKIK